MSEGNGSQLNLNKIEVSFVYNFLLSHLDFNSLITKPLQSISNFQFKGVNVIESSDEFHLLRPYLLLNERFMEFDRVDNVRLHFILTENEQTTMLKTKVKVFENGVGVVRIHLSIQDSGLILTKAIEILNIGERSPDEASQVGLKLTGSGQDESINSLSDLFKKTVKAFIVQIEKYQKGIKWFEDDNDIFSKCLRIRSNIPDAWFAPQSPYPIIFVETSDRPAAFKGIFKQTMELKDQNHDKALIQEVLSLLFRSITPYTPTSAHGINLDLCEKMELLQKTLNGWRLVGSVTEDIAFTSLTYRCGVMISPCVKKGAKDSEIIKTIKQSFRETIEFVRLRWYVNSICEFYLDRRIQGLEREYSKLYKEQAEFEFAKKMSELLKKSILDKAFIFRLFEDPAIHRIGAGAHNWLYSKAIKLFRMEETESINFEKIKALDRLHDEIWELLRLQDYLKTMRILQSKR